MMLPKASTNIKNYDGRTEWICFVIEDDDLSEK